MRSCRRVLLVVLAPTSVAVACSSFGSNDESSADAGSSTPPPLPGRPPPPPGDASDEAESDAGAAYRDLVMSDGPLAYWRMDEMSGPLLRDETPNHYDLTVAGGSPAYGVAGALGPSSRAIRFDGNAYAILDDLTKSRDFDFGNFEPFTIELWAKRDAEPPSSGTFRHFVGDIQNTAPNYFGYILYVQTSTSPPTLRFEYDSNVDSGIPDPNVFSNTSPIDRFVHYAVTFDGTKQLRLYVDGALSSNVKATVAMGPRSFHFIVGKEESSSTHGFLGAIDEIAVYPKALPIETIYAHYVLGN